MHVEIGSEDATLKDEWKCERQRWAARIVAVADRLVALIRNFCDRDVGSVVETDDDRDEGGEVTCVANCDGAAAIE